MKKMMKKIGIVIIVVGISVLIPFIMAAQNVGIGLSNPQAKLTIFDSVLSGTLYQTSGTTASDGFFVGMQSSKQARIVNFENAGLSLGTAGTERLSILANGNVGIGTSNPFYKLQVDGNSYFNGFVGIGDDAPDYPLDVNGGAGIDFIGINTPPTSTYRFDVLGASRFQNDVRINGILNPDNVLAIGSNTTIDGKLTVNKTHGIVRSSNATQLKTVLYSSPANLSVTMATGTQTDFGIVFGSFSSAPVVSIGNWVDPDGALSGSSATGLENLSITVLNVTTTDAVVRLKNVGNTTATLVNMVLRAIIIGAE